MDMRFGTWNVKSLNRAGALGLGTSEIVKNRMDLVGVQEVRLEGSGTLESGDYTLFYGEVNANQLGAGFLFIGAVKRVDLMSGRVSCIRLKGRRCVIITVNVHVPSKDKGDDIKDSFIKK
jgi:Endonuclease/Exonuclease/phosphatase family.